MRQAKVKQYSELIMKVKIGDYPASIAVLPFVNRVDIKRLMPPEGEKGQAEISGDSFENDVPSEPRPDEQEEQAEKDLEERSIGWRNS